MSLKVLVLHGGQSPHSAFADVCTALGSDVKCVDIASDVRENYLVSELFDALVAQIRQFDIVCLMLPCSTFAPGPPPLRGLLARDVYGVKGASLEHKDTVRIETAIAVRSAELISKLREFDLVWMASTSTYTGWPLTLFCLPEWMEQTTGVAVRSAKYEQHQTGGATGTITMASYDLTRSLDAYTDEAAFLKNQALRCIAAAKKLMQSAAADKTPQMMRTGRWGNMLLVKDRGLVGGKQVGAYGPSPPRDHPGLPITTMELPLR